jgi:hypothetical protein
MEKTVDRDLLRAVPQAAPGSRQIGGNDLTQNDAFWE